jgi:hypothetical protein
MADDLLACIVTSALCIARRIDIACQSGDLNMKDPFQAMDVVLPNQSVLPSHSGRVPLALGMLLCTHWLTSRSQQHTLVCREKTVMTYDLKAVAGQFVHLDTAVFHYALEGKHRRLVQETGFSAVHPSCPAHERHLFSNVGIVVVDI